MTLRRRPCQEGTMLILVRPLELGRWLGPTYTHSYNEQPSNSTDIYIVLVSNFGGAVLFFIAGDI